MAARGGRTRWRTPSTRCRRAPALIVIHDAARPFATAGLFTRVIEAAAKGGAAIAALQASDTVKEATAAPGLKIVARTIVRESIYLAQTPQAFSREVLEDAIARGRRKHRSGNRRGVAGRAGRPFGAAGRRRIDQHQNYDAARSSRVGGAVGRRSPNPKSPDSRSLEWAPGTTCIASKPAGRSLSEGWTIPHETGLAGHSDADVLCHAVTDAILGAAAAGDIGQHFPDTDPKWKGANSIELLKGAVAIVRAAGYAVANVDAVIIAERPKLAPHIPAMRANLAQALGIDRVRRSASKARPTKKSTRSAATKRSRCMRSR